VAKKSIYALMLVCGLWALPSQEFALMSQNTQRILRYDRIEVLGRFLRAVYPDLGDRLAMFDIDSTFEGKAGITIRNLKFYPCDPTHVIVPTIGLPMGLQAESSPQPNSPTPPPCGGEPTPEFEHFLDVSLDLGAGHEERPIFRFTASGTYVDGKLQNLRDQFAGKPYPTDDEAIRDLLSKQPKYGPINKERFLALVPLAKIREVTGCRLSPQTAKFIVELEENPQHLPPDLQWHIYGTAPAAKGLTADTCSAAFEPFEGHLTAFYD
jgi:hypothetical protein